MKSRWQSPQLERNNREDDTLYDGTDLDSDSSSSTDSSDSIEDDVLCHLNTFGFLIHLISNARRKVSIEKLNEVNHPTTRNFNYLNGSDKAPESSVPLQITLSQSKFNAEFQGLPTDDLEQKTIDLYALIKGPDYQNIDDEISKIRSDLPASNN